MPTRSLTDALSASAAGPLLARVSRARSISRGLVSAVAQLSPDFDITDPGVCELREDVLLLNANSAAQAAKLRQGVPGLLRILHQQGAQVTEIRVRVQPARTSYPERANDRAQASATVATGVGAPEGPATASAGRPAVVGADGAQQLARALVRDLPDSPLRRAAQRLQAALGKRGRGDAD